MNYVSSVNGILPKVFKLGENPYMVFTRSLHENGILKTMTLFLNPTSGRFVGGSYKELSSNNVTRQNLLKEGSEQISRLPYYFGDLGIRARDDFFHKLKI